MQRRREIFRILEIRPEAPYLHYFLDFQGADIRRFFPGYRYEERAGAGARLALLVLRDLVPAGVLLGVIRGERLEVDLDYVVPQYRDLKVGTYLFRDEADYFRRLGIREILASADTDAHASYLRRIGFLPSGDGKSWRLMLD
jgi:GNAT superfamily N-acetyltransferase